MRRCYWHVNSSHPSSKEPVPSRFILDKRSRRQTFKAHSSQILFDNAPMREVKTSILLARRHWLANQKMEPLPGHLTLVSMLLPEKDHDIVYVPPSNSSLVFQPGSSWEDMYKQREKRGAEKMYRWRGVWDSAHGIFALFKCPTRSISYIYRKVKSYWKIYKNSWSSLFAIFLL